MLHNNLIIFGLLILIGCDPASKIETAVATLDKIPTVVPESVKEAACPLIREQARPIVEAIWANDWSEFAPMFASPASPEDDEAYCRDVIAKHGAFILPGESHGMALRFVVLIPDGFDKRPAAWRAGLMCHEAAHIVRQADIGIKRAAIEYITPWGRLAWEATAYATYDATLRRHNVSAERIAKTQARRARQFPVKYKLTNTVTSECVAGYFADVDAALAERGGV